MTTSPFDFATTTWGVSTAAAGFSLSWLLAYTHSPLPLFAIGLLAAVTAGLEEVMR